MQAKSRLLVQCHESEKVWHGCVAWMCDMDVIYPAERERLDDRREVRGSGTGLLCGSAPSCLDRRRPYGSWQGRCCSSVLASDNGHDITNFLHREISVVPADD